MNYEDTICSKIGKCQQELEHGIKTRSLNMHYLSRILTDIQSDAIHMETALKINKELREKHNIDAEYRQRMEQQYKKTGINEFEKVEGYTPERPQFELTIKEVSGKVVYQNTIHAFIMCAVEKLNSIDEQGVIDGVVQTLAIGQDFAVLYAFDQLRQKFASKLIELSIKMESFVENGKLKSKEFLQQLLNQSL